MEVNNVGKIWQGAIANANVVAVKKKGIHLNNGENVCTIYVT